jgi:hypothetical protein
LKCTVKQWNKILMFTYPIYNHKWRNISTIYRVYITRLASNEIFSPSNKIHREVGRAKDLSAHCTIQSYVKFNTFSNCSFKRVIYFPYLLYLPFMGWNFICDVEKSDEFFPVCSLPRVLYPMYSIFFPLNSQSYFQFS